LTRPVVLPHRADPRWASANLGVFMCIRCSGIHRSMGVHISFVRSVTMDSWKEAQVRNMARWGNRKANEYFEAAVPRDYYIPSESDGIDVVERWIRDKVRPASAVVARGGGAAALAATPAF